MLDVRRENKAKASENNFIQALNEMVYTCFRLIFEPNNMHILHLKA